MLVDMQINDGRLVREDQILGKLRDLLRSTRALRGLQNPSPQTSSLYSRYEGKGFPLRKIHNHRTPRWKDLSPWMKIQIYLLVLGERGYRPIKVQLHDDVRSQLMARGQDERVYLRERLKRSLRKMFGSSLPMFFFVMEDRDRDGTLVRSHAHGAIEICPYPLEQVADRKARRHLERIRAKHGLEEAERQAGRWATRVALKAAVGLESKPRIAGTGVDQSRNIWMRKPTFPFFNQDWVTYCLKNVFVTSPTLQENRLVRDYQLLGEAKKLWGIIRG